MTHRIAEVVPVFTIGSYDEAVVFYVDWLGFSLDWEWREAPGRPVVMAISRDGVSLMLVEQTDSPSASWLNLKVDDLGAFAEEWNSRRPNSVTVGVSPPYEIPTVSLQDPFGNRLDFEQPVSAEEQAARDARIPHMREYIRHRLADHGVCPAPEQVVEAVGGPIGLAIEIMGEFPEYEHAAR